MKPGQLSECVRFLIGCAFYLLGMIAVLVVAVLVILQECGRG
jgi:chloramphenicol 3-O-phosphotransferase